VGKPVFVGPIEPHALSTVLSRPITSPPAGYHYVASGRQAIRLLARSIGLRPGARVALPALICNVAVRGIEAEGLRPDFVDIELDHFFMRFDRETFARRRFDLILLPHLYGVPHPQTAELMAFAKEEGIPLVHDAAQSYGLTWRGRPVIEHNQGGLYSFGAGKASTAAAGALVYGLTEEVVARHRLCSLRRRNLYASQFLRHRAGLSSLPGYERLESRSFRASRVQVQAAQHVVKHMPTYDAARRANLAALDDLLGEDLYADCPDRVSPYKWVGRAPYPHPRLREHPFVPQHRVPRPDELVEVSTERNLSGFRRLNRRRRIAYR
jgi:dTDP-4-amino-4,6-dideoxygalactose transaminase